MSNLQDTWRQEEGGTGRDVSNAKYKAGEEGFTVIHCPAEPSRGSPSRDTPRGQALSLGTRCRPSASPSTRVLASTRLLSPRSRTMPSKMASASQISVRHHHWTVTAALPCSHATHLACADITVSVVQADCVLVGGQPKSALAHVDSIGGNFAGFVKALCDGLAPMGVAAGNVTATFRSVGMKEFAMNGSPLG